MNAKVTITSLMNIHELISSSIRRAKAPLVAALNNNNFSSFTSDDVLDFAVIGAAKKLKKILDLNDDGSSLIPADYDQGIIEHIRIAWSELMLIVGSRDVFDGVEGSVTYISDVLAAAIEDLDTATSLMDQIVGGSL